jgi:hypothetical protein
MCLSLSAGKVGEGVERFTRDYVAMGALPVPDDHPLFVALNVKWAWCGSACQRHPLLHSLI